jgi:predicted peroxiredoxin
MKIGILVNTDRHLKAVVGIARAAVAKGHEVTIFNMDIGTRLLKEPDFRALCSVEGINMSFCDHSAKEDNVPADDVPGEIHAGSQFDNANMNHNCDRVIVL